MQAERIDTQTLLRELFSASDERELIEVAESLLAIAAVHAELVGALARSLDCDRDAPAIAAAVERLLDERRAIEVIVGGGGAIEGVRRLAERATILRLHAAGVDAAWQQATVALRELRARLRRVLDLGEGEDVIIGCESLVADREALRDELRTVRRAHREALRLAETSAEELRRLRTERGDPASGGQR
jgi:hypothetical protein